MPSKVGKVVLRGIQRKKGHSLDKMMKLDGLDLIEKVGSSSRLFVTNYSIVAVV